MVCKPCPRNFFASLHRDSCFTLDLLNPPSSLSPGKDVGITGISIRYLIGPPIVASFPFLRILLVLVKKPANASIISVVSVNATFNNSKWSTTFIQLPSDASVIPASDFYWSLRLVEPITSEPIVFDNFAVSVLDVSPVIAALSSPDVPFTGGVITVDCEPVRAPLTKFFLPLFTVPNVTNSSCVFLSKSGLASFSQLAHITLISSSIIKLRCAPLSGGQLGPVYSVWKVRAVLPDGRESPESSTSLTVRCPAGMYIQTNASVSCTSPPCCQTCPSPMSISFGVDRIGIQSCVCQIGYYGSGGMSCTACPRSAKYGFNCTLPGLQFPLVKPGFYIDYSLLSKCTEEICRAVVKCPNPLACPGSGEHNCLRADDECYSNRSAGCTLCCSDYYSDNFICRKCPESRLLVVLALAILLLIVFAILSSYLSFPPFVACAKGMKLILSGLQSFTCIRLMTGLSTNEDGVLAGVNWPPIMLSAFESMNAFTFSFDSLRPECSFDFSARTKLILMTTGPFFVVIAILFLAVAHSIWKIYRIYTHIRNANLLTDETLNVPSLFRSIAHCFVVSTFSMKYSRDNQVVHGSLWPALDPGLIQRSDISVAVLRSKRRVTTLEKSDALSYSDQLAKLPHAWRKLVFDFQQSGVSKSMSDATHTTRLLISSALSVFIFTFQGVLETLLSTWDCKVLETRRFLRYRPNIECSVSNSPLYLDMVIVSSVGLVLYTLVLPISVVFAIRSRWASEIYAYNYMAYEHLFGFITSQYTAAFFSWEAINCFRKMALVAFPIIISSSPIVQSLFNIFLFLVYAMIIIGCKPMVSSFLNTIELLNSFNIIVTSFAALMFTIQYENVYVLQGDSRDTVGIVLVVFISFMFSISLRLIYIEVNRLFALHQNLYLSKWLCLILARTGGSVILDKYLPISLLFFNKISSRAIQDEVDAKDAVRQQVFSRISRTWFSSNAVASCVGHVVLAWAKIMLHFKQWHRAATSQVDDDLINKTLAEPDYEFFLWMHKLQQRVSAWTAHEKEFRKTSIWELPKKFILSYGESDPPVAVCDSLLRTSRAVGEILNEDHKNLLLAFLLQDGNLNIRENLDDGKCLHYQERMSAMIGAFKKQLSKHIDASDTFRSLSETHLQMQTCRPLRQRLYKAVQSDDIDMLQFISRTTLPQFRRLSGRKSFVAQSEGDGPISGGRSSTVAAPPGRRSSRVMQRGMVQSVSQHTPDPSTAINLGKGVSNLENSCRTTTITDSGAADGVELQEVIVERLDDSQVQRDSVSRAASNSRSSKADTARTLITAQGFINPQIVTEAKPDARRKSATRNRLPEASRNSASAAASALSPAKTGRHNSPQPHQMLESEPGRTAKYSTATATLAPLDGGKSSVQKRADNLATGRDKPLASILESRKSSVHLSSVLDRELVKSPPGAEAIEPVSNSAESASIFPVAYAQLSGQTASSVKGQSGLVMKQKQQDGKSRPSKKATASKAPDLSDFPPPPPYEYEWA